jgi:hypothetical protein
LIENIEEAFPAFSLSAPPNRFSKVSGAGVQMETIKAVHHQVHHALEARTDTRTNKITHNSTQHKKTFEHTTQITQQEIAKHKGKQNMQVQHNNISTETTQMIKLNTRQHIEMPNNSTKRSL